MDCNRHAAFWSDSPSPLENRYSCIVERWQIKAATETTLQTLVNFITRVQRHWSAGYLLSLSNFLSFWYLFPKASVTPSPLSLHASRTQLLESLWPVHQYQAKVKGNSCLWYLYLWRKYKFPSEVRLRVSHTLWQGDLSLDYSIQPLPPSRCTGIPFASGGQSPQAQSTMRILWRERE